MSAIFGALGVNDSDRVFTLTTGQAAIFDAVNTYLARVNAEMQAAYALFVEGETDAFKLRYYLPGGGYLQRRGSQGTYGNVKATGSWDVALPLEDFGATMGMNDVDMAYMSVAQLSRHVETIAIQNVNTVRYEMLKAIFNSTAGTFIDPLHGSLTVERLANGDSVVYPPVLGATTEATDTHYLEAGYAGSAISDTNNPYPTIAAELEEHFGAPTGGGNIVVLSAASETAKIRALADFVPVAAMGVKYGSTQDLAEAIPAEVRGVGRVLGRMEAAGAWAVEWRALPSNYMIGIHLDAPKPLLKRVDPADTGLARGLVLLPGMDEEKPFAQATWRHRFGFGVGNRLNGVVLELANGGGYTVPTGY